MFVLYIKWTIWFWYCFNVATDLDSRYLMAHYVKVEMRCNLV